MASLVDLVEECNPYLFPYLPECPQGIINQQLYNSAKEFCKRTQAWVETITLTIEEDQQQYYFLNQVNDNAQWHCVFDIQRTNEIEDLNTVTLAQMTATKQFQGQDYSLIRDEEEVFYVFLHSKPNKTRINALHIRNVLLPLQSEMKMPDWIMRDWSEGIAYGAQAYLKSQPGTGWYDPAGAAMANQKWLHAINQCRILLNKSYANGNIQLRIPIAPRYNRKGLWGLNGQGEVSVNV